MPQNSERYKAYQRRPGAEETSAAEMAEKAEKAEKAEINEMAEKAEKINKTEKAEAAFAPGARLQRMGQQTQPQSRSSVRPTDYVQAQPDAYARRDADEPLYGESTSERFAPGVQLPLYGQAPEQPTAEGGESALAVEQILQAPVNRSGALYHYYAPQQEMPVSDVPYEQDDPFASLQEAVQEGYQVQEEGHKVSKIWLILLLLVAVLAIGLVALFFAAEEKPADLPQSTALVAANTEPPAMQAFHYSTEPEMQPQAREGIMAISGAVQMESAHITAQNIVTRTLRRDGLYDFYVFSAQGELLCYFDGLGSTGVFPGENHTLYSRQSPYLIQANGQPVIPAGVLQQAAGGACRLMPMHCGWSLMERETDARRNLINEKGELISETWLDVLFPFSGSHTLGCVDTGNLGSEERYIWYIFSREGEMSRWFATGQAQAVAAVLSNLAYLADGRVYDLGQIEQPLQTAARAVCYPDMGATVLWQEDGTCGLWMDGKYCYEPQYTAIAPVEGELQWDMLVSAMPNIGLRVYTLHAANAKRPISCTFELSGAQGTEYASLSVSAAAAFDGLYEWDMLGH